MKKKTDKVGCNTNNSRCRHGQEDDYHRAIDEGLDSHVKEVTRNVWRNSVSMPPLVVSFPSGFE